MGACLLLSYVDNCWLNSDKMYLKLIVERL